MKTIRETEKRVEEREIKEGNQFFLENEEQVTQGRRREGEREEEGIEISSSFIPFILLHNFLKKKMKLGFDTKMKFGVFGFLPSLREGRMNCVSRFRNWLNLSDKLLINLGRNLRE